MYTTLITTFYFLVVTTLNAQNVLSNVVKSDRLPPYPCVEDMRGWCRFSSIRLLQGRYRFQPFTDKANEDIRKVAFDDSVIPILASDVCDTFTNLEELWLDNLEIKNIMVNAFKNCKKLRYLRMHQNDVTDLPSDIFKHNRNLKILFIEGNKVRKINSQWFNELSELEEFYFCLTLIDYFPIAALKAATKLKKLVLYSNNLIDLDERLIISQFPQLREIFYNKNEFSCKRAIEMNNTFTTSGIKIMTETWGATRLRSYNTTIIDGIDCLPDDAWVKMLRNKLVGFFEQPQATTEEMVQFTMLTNNHAEIEHDHICEQKFNALSFKSQRMQSLILEQQEFIKALLIKPELFDSLK